MWLRVKGAMLGALEPVRVVLKLYKDLEASLEALRSFGFGIPAFEPPAAQYGPGYMQPSVQEVNIAVYGRVLKSRGST